MEVKLAEYRARKRQGYINTNNIKKFFGGFFFKNQATKNEIDLVDQSISDSLPTEKSSGHQDRDKKGPDTPQSWTVKWTLIGLQILLWFTLWGFCIQNEFGSVYILLSLFYFIYKGTRTGPKDNKKLSAYSVFNPNCERIDGTFTAEQFEKELRYGAGAVK